MKTLKIEDNNGDKIILTADDDGFTISDDPYYGSFIPHEIAQAAIDFMTEKLKLNPDNQ